MSAAWVIYMGPFGKRFLVTLFVFFKIRVDKKTCENTCNVV